MKYNFCVKRDETSYNYLRESRISDLYNLGFHQYVLKINTNIKVEDDKIFIMSNKENAKNIYGKEIQKWRFGSFKFENREANIKDIKTIEYKNCFLLSLLDLIISLFLFLIVLWYILIQVESIVSAVRNSVIFIDVSSITLLISDLVLVGLLICWTSKLTFRSLKININNDKPIIFPYRAVPRDYYEDSENIRQLEKLINELESYGVDVKGKLK